MVSIPFSLQCGCTRDGFEVGVLVQCAEVGQGLVLGDLAGCLLLAGDGAAVTGIVHGGRVALVDDRA